MSPTSLAAYLVLFASVGLLFLLVSLLLGRLLRADAPTPAKLETYECGEPAVGTSFIQFDLRFYVVALVFIVFEVEVALFFPPAVIYGAATQWMKAEGPAAQTGFEADMGVMAKHSGDAADKAPQYDVAGNARALALAAAADLAVFFAVILLGFAYVWRRGDLNWVPSRSRVSSRGPRGSCIQFHKK